MYPELSFGAVQSAVNIGHSISCCLGTVQRGRCGPARASLSDAIGLLIDPQDTAKIRGAVLRVVGAHLPSNTPSSPLMAC